MDYGIEKGKTYLVTGGSGFLGKSLIKRILNSGPQLFQHV